MQIKIGKKIIGENAPAYIIFEIARTYENDINKAKKMIKAAAECGADAVKIQSIDAEGLMILDENTKDYFEKLKKLEKTKEEHKILLEFCQENNIEFLSTPESFKMIDLLDEIGINAFKVSSLDLTYYDFLKYMAKKGKPIILSTGMANEKEIEKAIKIIKNEGNDQIILLHCVSLYPPILEELNLGMIKLIEKKLNLISGFSDHTPDIKASIAAIALGAKVIEKHFKIDEVINSEWKQDYEVAINPEQGKELVKYSKILSEKIENKKLLGNEIERKKIRGRKLVANRELKENEIILRQDLICKQNLNEAGIDSSRIEEIVGKISKKILKKNEIIRFEDLK